MKYVTALRNGRIERMREISEREITGVKVYMPTGTIELPATNVENDRMVDEVIIYEGNVVTAIFYFRNIFGYEVIRERNEFRIDPALSGFKCGEY